jgi:hypothetical protein
MPTTRTLLVQFYKPYWRYYFIFTALSSALLLSKGAIALMVALPIKLIGYGGAVFYQHQFYRNEYYYYRNTGASMRRLYSYTIATDFVLFSLLAALSILIFYNYA